MLTHYQSASRGPVEIASMNARHIANALAKIEPHRMAEIKALQARLAVLEAEAEQPNAEEAPALIGHNLPPAPTPFEAIKAHIDDLLLEARNWADGVTVETEEQSAAVKRLMDDLREGEQAADAERVREKEPLDKAIQAIQDRYNVYIAPLKNRKPGKIPLALEALKKTREPYLLKLEAERRAAAEKARLEAEEKARAAQAAIDAARASSDLAAREQAEALVDEASLAAAFAAKAEKPVATGLRTYWIPTLTDPKAALLHYVAEQPDRVKAFLLQLAQEDVRAGKRQIPGVTVTEEKRAA